MINISLAKLKYRNPDRRLLKRGSNFGATGGVIDPPEGTWTFNGGRFKAKTANQKTKDRPNVILRPRRKSYGPF